MTKKSKQILTDTVVIKALGILGIDSKGISVEELLSNSSTKRNNHKLPQRFTKKWFRQILAEGLVEQHLWLKNSFINILRMILIK